MPTQHHLITLNALVLSVFVGTPCKAELIFDNFDLDSSADYAGSDSFGTGGSFSVDSSNSNVLRVATGTNNTFSVLHSASSLGVGESFSIDVPFYTGNDGVFAMISTGLVQPDGTSTFGFRLRLDADSNFRIGKFSSSGNDFFNTGVSNPKTAMTVWIDRKTLTGFEFYHGAESNRTFIYSESLAVSDVSDPLHVGVQAFGNPANSFEFDNLQIASVPEPSAIAILILGLTVHGFRRRKILRSE